MRRGQAFASPVHRLVAVLSLVFAVMSAGAATVRADGLDASNLGGASLGQALARALHNYGWRPDTIAYMTAHTHLVETQQGLNSPCPTAVACSLRDGTVFLNQIPGNPATLDYVLNHEYIHAIEYARGSVDSSVGPILEDLLTLTTDTDHPLAAQAARRALSLTAQNDHSAVTGHDWFHLEHDVLEDVGWDVANLPDWYRDAYFPYLMPNPPVRKAVAVVADSPPRDWDLRMTHVLDAIVKMCGPVLPGSRLTAASSSCDPGPMWAGVPYARLSGGAAPSPASTVVADQPTQAQAPQPEPIMALNVDGAYD